MFIDDSKKWKNRQDMNNVFITESLKTQYTFLRMKNLHTIKCCVEATQPKIGKITMK